MTANHDNAVEAKFGATINEADGGSMLLPMRTVSVARTHFGMRAVAVVAALTLAMCGFALVGCKDSDALKEIVYDQRAEIIDYDNPHKFYINDSTAEETNDDLPASETSEDGKITEERQNLVVYSSDPNTQGYIAKQSLWSAAPDFEGLEASSSVSFYKTDDPTASEQDLPDDEEEEEEEDTPEDPEEPNENTPAGDGSGTSASNGSGRNGNGSSNNKGDSDDGKGDADANEGNDGANDGGWEEVANDEGDSDDGGMTNDKGDKVNPYGNVDIDLTSPDADPPQSDKIAAYGDLAVLVQMIGGKGALAAADSDLLDSDFSSVFSDEGASEVKRGWSGDGTGESSINVDAIIESGASTVLVYQSSELTDGEKQALKEKGVSVAQAYTMTNSKYIKANARNIGDMLASSSELAEGWNSEEMAERYVSFYDNLIKNACATSNGGEATLAGSEVFEVKNSKSYSFNNAANYTLLLDQYDSSASFNSKIDGWQPVANGALLTTVGNSLSPISYYIQAGGLVNNSATKQLSKSGAMVAWQFNANIASYAKGKWSYDAGGPMDSSINITTNIAGGWTLCPFIANRAIQSADLDATMTNTFGSSTFPKVIVCSQRAKTALIDNSANENGIYHPFSKVSTSDGVVNISFFGKLTSGGTQVYSSIGIDTNQSNSENQFANGRIADDAVEVNPCGLFSSWVEGTSPEAVLEAAWVNDVVNTASPVLGYSYGSYTGYEAYIAEFYDTFYRFDVSSYLPTIEAGSVQ